MQVLLIFACMLASICAQRTMYRVSNFPDPIDRFGACGRPRPSFVCDPSGQLPANAADVIDDVVKSIYNETTVLGYGSMVSRRKGYMIMVAVLPKMQRYFTVNTTGYSMQTRYREAQYFSYYLGQASKWGKHSSKLNEMVIILYSADDGVLYTSTQPVARKLLTDEKVRDTVMEALTYHYPFNASKRRTAETIEFMVRKYGDLLRADLPTA
ncbi:uncharacterized protein LOC132716213 [Ruditapes philippinarum]|uniref:uncharacterized protein LOC132716213 n=1 Tax=Ruditapes philippinarum TaxID=129788 RepID=UPI00295B59FC|nr:uncharacterized protein LOC132716213 [Ruditapes philippinarum]